jgi:ornithine decarboxylase
VIVSRVFSTPHDVIDQLQPDEPIYCFRPHVLSQTAKEFISLFNGDVLYAVKCNSHPDVLRCLYENGVRGFDVASLAEIQLIKSLFPEAHCAFMHPVKSRPSIRAAYHQFGIRHFVIDSLHELEKIEEETNQANDLVIFIRFRTEAHKEVEYDLSDKFGADVDTTLSLIARVTPYHTLGLAFHVGSQCTDPHAYHAAIERLKNIITRSGVTPAFVDIGGGFPTYYQGTHFPSLNEYLTSINQSLKTVDQYGKFTVLSEPGRVLANEAFSLLIQVQLRKNDSLYVNDGVYGALGELPHLRNGAHAPARLLRDSEHPSLTWFNLYGPTCDSTDIMKHVLELPEDVREGDWIEIGLSGAYTHCMSTHFNGFSSQHVVTVTDEPFYSSRLTALK